MRENNRVYSILKVSLGCLAMGLWLVACTNRLNTKRSTTVNSPSIEASETFADHIIGHWKMVARDAVDGLGKVVDRSEFQLLEFPGQDKDKTELKEKSYDGFGITFNSAGEVFQEMLKIGSSYHVEDSILHMNGEWKILELNDQRLQMLEIPDLMDLNLGGMDRVTYERVNSEDLPSTNPLIKKLIVGDWESYQGLNVKVNGNVLFVERERIIDTLMTSNESGLSLSLGYKSLKFGPKSSSQKVDINYQIADSMIMMDSGEYLFHILKISQDSLSLLGPFDQSDIRMQLNYIRKKQ